MIRRLMHRIAHLFGQEGGRVETWWDGPHLMVGFRCTGCDALTEVHESLATRERPGRRA